MHKASGFVDFRCPNCVGELAMVADAFLCEACDIKLPGMDEAIVDFTYPQQLSRHTRGTKSHYDGLAENYERLLVDEIQGAQPQLRRRLAQRLQLSADSLVLEVGIGTGNNLPYILDAAPRCRLVGVDFSLPMLRQCREVVPPHLGEMTLALANGEHLPFGNEQFDAVLHFGSICDYERPERGLAEATRVLRRGGRLVVGGAGLSSRVRNEPWARTLMRRNPAFATTPPVDLLPPAVTVAGQENFYNLYYILTLEKRPSD